MLLHVHVYGVHSSSPLHSSILSLIHQSTCIQSIDPQSIHNPSIHSFIYSSLHPFNHSFDPMIHNFQSVHLFIDPQSIHPFIPSIHPLIHSSFNHPFDPMIHNSLIRSSIHRSIVHPSIHSFNPSIDLQSIHPFIHSSIHPFIHSSLQSIHSSIHPFILQPSL